VIAPGAPVLAAAGPVPAAARAAEAPPPPVIDPRANLMVAAAWSVFQ
jgi:hypothetical protein